VDRSGELAMRKATSPPLWHEKFPARLVKRLRRISEAPYFFVNGNLFLISFVDDTIILSPPDSRERATKLSGLQTNPSRYHHEAADSVIRYLYETKSSALEYSRGTDTFLCASDAAFADDIDRTSTLERYLFKLLDGP